MEENAKSSLKSCSKSLVFGIVVAVLAIATVLVLIFCCCKKKTNPADEPIEQPPSAIEQPPSAPLESNVSALRAYYSEMRGNLNAFAKTFGNWHMYLKNLANNAYNGKWSQADQDKFADDAMNTRPILHEDMVPLLKSFLAYKQQNGSPIEIKVYNQSFNGRHFDIVDLFDRLLKKRPVAFLNSTDDHLLRDGSELKGSQPFDVIGTIHDNALLWAYMSYEEMMLSALMTVSCPVQLINNGALDNLSKPMKSGTFQPTAIYLGQVGSRFERADADLMEHRHMVADSSRNYNQYPMLPFYEKFYGVHAGTLTSAKFTYNRFMAKACPVMTTGWHRHKQQFQLPVVTSRYRKSAEVHLAEGQFYGEKYDQDVRIYAVGLGTGAWAPTPPSSNLVQDPLLLSALIVQNYIELVRERHHQYSRIKVVEFNYTGMTEAFRTKRHMFPHVKGELTKHPDGRLSFVDPKSKVTFMFHGSAYEQKGCPFVPSPQLIVANFAWDGNSFPGNEYWLSEKMLNASGDPAAAASSTIWNHLNPEFNGKYMCGENAQVMLKNGGWRKLTEYRN